MTYRSGQRAETSVPKPHEAEGEIRRLREAHTSLCNAESRVREPRKDPHKLLISKVQPSMQGGTREQKHKGRFQGQVGG